MKFLKRFFSTILLLFLITSQLFAASSRQIANAAEFLLHYGNKYIFKSRTIDILRAAAEGQGGVMFRAIAVPDDIRLLEQSIALRYNENENDGSRLQISFGSITITENNLMDWMLLPIAAYADTPYYNCVTLLASPVEKKEVYRLEYAKENGSNLYFAEFHPAFLNTLVGLNLLLVDAIFINPIVCSLPYRPEIGILNDYNANSNIKNIFNQYRSYDSFLSINKILFDETYQQKYDSYIFSDPNEGISFKIENNQIKFNEKYFPYYHFLRASSKNRQYVPVNDITNDIKNSGHIKNISPAIFNTAEKTCYWAAFFRFVKTKAPDAWYDFMLQIAPKITDSRYIVGQGPKNGIYEYKFDKNKEDYHLETPRMFGFIGDESYFDHFIAKKERLDLEYVKTLTKKQQEIYSTLNYLDKENYLNLMKQLNEKELKYFNILSSENWSVCLNLSSYNEMLSYINLSQPHRAACDKLITTPRRQDFLSLNELEKTLFISLTPIQQEMWFNCDDKKQRNLLLSDSYKFILDNSIELKKRLTAKQFEIFSSLSEKQKEIFFSIAIQHEREAYLSLSPEQREFCDELSIAERYDLLSLSPKERTQYIFEKTNIMNFSLGSMIKPNYNKFTFDRPILNYNKFTFDQLFLTPAEKVLFDKLDAELQAQLLSLPKNIQARIIRIYLRDNLSKKEYKEFENLFEHLE